MPVFEAAAEAKDEPLVLPCPTLSGRVVPFAIPPLSAEDLPRFAALARAVNMTFAGMGDRVAQETYDDLDRMTEQQYLELVLSPAVFEQMIGEKLGGKMMLNVAVTAQTWHLNGLERARSVWDTIARGVDPTAPTSPGKAGNNTRVTSSTGSLNTSSRHPKKSRKKKTARAGR